MEIKKSEYRENVESFAIAVLTILFVMIFIAQSFLVKGSSMEPTLHDGERLIVCKFIFQLRPPVTGDIVVLKYPKDPSLKFIKRVIAKSGQTVSIQDSKVFVEGQELNEPYLRHKTMENYNFTVVPEGTVFVMGDNRNGSKDSRNPDVGFVPLKNLIGKAVFIFWPLPKMEILVNPKYPNLPASHFSPVESGILGNLAEDFRNGWRNLVYFFQNLWNKLLSFGHSNFIKR